MSKTNQIANRFREVILNGKWIANTNIKDQLADVTLQEATTKIDSLNTIAVLIFHINYYIAGLVHFFETGSLEIKDKYSFDMPPIESEEDWKQQVNSLLINSEKFASHVESMSDQKLDEMFINTKYGTYQRNIDGMIEHTYYHFGQISLIKKLVKEKFIQD